MTDDIRRLTESLDSVLWDHLRVLADAHEEAGDATMAAGYRWLVGHHKVPYHTGRRWRWWASSNWVRDPVDGGKPRYPSDSLPPKVVAMLRLAMGCKPGECASLSTAYHEAARAVGRWLATYEVTHS